MSEMNYCPHCGHNLSQYVKPKDAYGEDDPIFSEVVKFVIESQKASASLFQRRFQIGYARAARIMDALEDHEIIGPADGAKPREVLFKDQFDYLYAIAVNYVVSEQKASTALLQQVMGITYEVASRIMDRLELHGIVGPADGKNPRIVLRREE